MTIYSLLHLHLLLVASQKKKRTPQTYTEYISKDQKLKFWVSFMCECFEGSHFWEHTHTHTHTHTQQITSLWTLETDILRGSIRVISITLTHWNTTQSLCTNQRRGFSKRSLNNHLSVTLDENKLERRQWVWPASFNFCLKHRGLRERW